MKADRHPVVWALASAAYATTTSKRMWARKSGVTRQKITGILDGTDEPTIAQLEHMARALRLRLRITLDGNAADAAEIVYCLIRTEPLIAPPQPTRRAVDTANMEASDLARALHVLADRIQCGCAVVLSTTSEGVPATTDVVETFRVHMRDCQVRDHEQERPAGL